VRSALRIAPIVVLVAVAAAFGLAAYYAFSPAGPKRTDWARAAAAARRAERTKAQVPALRMRARAIELFRSIAASGPPEARSRAAMLEGLLILGEARTSPDRRQELLAASVASLQRAVRLDRANDDAAYDLELLLEQAKAASRPILQTPRKTPSKRGMPQSSRPGSGY
jgi:hypothetical protein